MEMPLTSDLRVASLFGTPLLSLEDFFSDEAGATSIEYALIGGLVSLVIIAAAATLGDELLALYQVFGIEVAKVNTL